ncbi:MAG: ATP-binding cassette domain-containing protein [Coriobacteriales bacterium]|jgi:zinc transport system ATP-binding protein|nr:ATP-binding cassette domain-containing protein [Coriobacteriales bacterium]
MNTILSCHDGVFGHEGNPQLETINFELVCGDYLCIVGENGSGKTTLLETILGILPLLGGKLDFGDGLNASQISYVPQQNHIMHNFPAKVLELVQTGSAGLPRRDFSKTDLNRACHAALAAVGLISAAHLSFSALSGGEQQRILMARALVCAFLKPQTKDPSATQAQMATRLLILDEPMNGLDPKFKQSLYDLIDRLCDKQGLTIIMVTHDVNSAVRHASKILLLDEQGQRFFGSAHQFQHTRIGNEIIRDSCGSHCAVCGMELDAGAGEE